MRKREITTSDLSDFGFTEIKLLIELLNAWMEQGLPMDFEHDGVLPMMNTNSGFVFLTNESYQVAMMNGERLESFYHCSKCWNEGFKEDCQLNDEGCNICACEENKD